MKKTKMKIFTVSIFICFSMALGYSEQDILGGFSIGVSADLLGMADIVDNAELLPASISVEVFSVPFSGQVYSLGLVMETDVVCFGWMLRAGCECPVALADWLSFDPGLAFSFGYRTEEQIMTYGVFYGAISLDLPLAFSIEDLFDLRIGSRVIAYLKGADHYEFYTGQIVVSQHSPVTAFAFPFFASVRIPL